MSNFEKISPTALLTAYARQFSGLPYTKEIADLTNASVIVNEFINQVNEQPNIMFALLEARYRAIDLVSSRFNQSQILELASGFLPRGMLLSQNPEITFVESDLPATVVHKRQIVEQLISTRSNLHFLEIEATKSDNFQSIKHYFRQDRPVTILCEGLLMYLTLTEKQQVFANVKSLLQIYGGVWITPDLTTKTGLGQMRKTNPAVLSVDIQIVNSTGRSHFDDEFDDLQQVRKFVREQGFQIEEFSMLDVLDQLNSISILEIDPARIKSVLAVTPVFVLTLL